MMWIKREYEVTGATWLAKPGEPHGGYVSDVESLTFWDALLYFLTQETLDSDMRYVNLTPVAAKVFLSLAWDICPEEDWEKNWPMREAVKEFNEGVAALMEVFPDLFTIESGNVDWRPIDSVPEDQYVL